MVAFRIGFDASQPAFLSRETPVAGQTFAADADLPWKELGLSEADLFTWWRAGLVYFRSPEQHTDAELERLTAPSEKSKASRTKR